MKALELGRVLEKEIIIDQTCAKVFALFSFITLTTLGAYVRIPLAFTPVPITLQTFFVLLAGAVLGRHWGTISQLGYLALGIMGLPIFTGASFGLVALFGPTAGYLFGFVFAAWVIGRMLSRYQAPRFNQVLMIMLLGSLLINLLGCFWLGIFLKHSWKKILLLGLWPFFPGDILKSIAASVIYQRIQKRTKPIFY